MIDDIERRERAGADDVTRRVRRAAVAWCGGPLLAATLSLGSPGTASAGDVAASDVAALLDWIERVAERDVDALRRTPPTIVMAVPGERLALGDEALVIAPEMGGVWDTGTARIVLVEPWDAGDPVDRSVLLHELVHALQSAEGASVCGPEAEWEAYALQSTWLAEHGILMLVDWHEVWEHALCEEEAAP